MRQEYDFETGELTERDHTPAEKAQLKKDAKLVEPVIAKEKARSDAIKVLRESKDPAHKAMLTLLGHDEAVPISPPVPLDQ